MTMPPMVTGKTYQELQHIGFVTPDAILYMSVEQSRVVGRNLD